MTLDLTDNEIIIHLPRYQSSYDALGDDCGQVDNLLGVIAGDEYTLSQAIDMTYKGKSAQEGMPIVHFNTREELLDICKRANIEVIKHDICSECKKVIYGCSTYNDNLEPLCYPCEIVGEK